MIKTKNVNLYAVGVIVLMIIFSASVVPAQSSDTSEIAIEASMLANEKTKLDIVKEKLAIIEGLRGKVDGSGAKFGAQLKAYGALEEVAKKIAWAVKQNKPILSKKIIMIDKPFNRGKYGFIYKTLTNNMDELRKEFEGLGIKIEKKEKAPSAGILPVPSSAPSFLPSVVPGAELLAMFKTDTTIESVDIPETGAMPLMLLVKKNLNKERVDVVISEFVSEVINATCESKIYAKYIDLSSMNVMANNRLSKKNDKKSKERNQKLKDVMAKFNAIEKKYFSDEELPNLLFSEYCMNASETGTQFLYVKVLSMGGEIRTDSGFLTKKIRHLGGAIAQYALYDNNRIIDSGVVSDYDGYSPMNHKTDCMSPEGYKTYDEIDKMDEPANGWRK